AAAGSGAVTATSGPAAGAARSAASGAARAGGASAAAPAGAGRVGAGPAGTSGSGGPSAAAAGGSAAGGQAGPAGGGGTAGGPVAGLPNGGVTDIGVTADKILIGGVWFHESYLDRYSRVAEHATRAFFNAINRAGGVFGRKIEYVSCIDGGDSSRARACFKDLVENKKVFMPGPS